MYGLSGGCGQRSTTTYNTQSGVLSHWAKATLSFFSFFSDNAICVACNWDQTKLSVSKALSQISCGVFSGYQHSCYGGDFPFPSTIEMVMWSWDHTDNGDIDIRCPDASSHVIAIWIILLTSIITSLRIWIFIEVDIISKLFVAKMHWNHCHNDWMNLLLRYTGVW